MPHEITATLMWNIYKEIMESPITIRVTDYTWERRQCGPVPALLFDDLPEPMRRFSNFAYGFQYSTPETSIGILKLGLIASLAEHLHATCRNELDFEYTPKFYDFQQAIALQDIVIRTKKFYRIAFSKVRKPPVFICPYW